MFSNTNDRAQTEPIKPKPEEPSVLDLLRSIKNSLRETICCPICFENYNENRPRVLFQCPCKKKLCVDCAVEINKKARPKCPICNFTSGGDLIIEFDEKYNKEVKEIMSSINDIAEDAGLIKEPKPIRKHVVEFKSNKMIKKREKFIKKLTVSVQKPYKKKKWFVCQCGQRYMTEQKMIGHIFSVHYPINFKQV